MSRTVHSQSTGFLLICLVAGLTSTSLPEANAQYNCVTCADQQANVPMYLQFGVDPYRPRQINYAPFTPLQLNLYQAPRLSSCPPCETLQRTPALDVVKEPASAVGGEPAVPITLDAPDPRLSRAIPKPVTETNANNENTVSSPSDILLSPDKPSKPTLADDSSSENMAQLDQARKRIARLKAEVAAAKEQARVASDRAYAAEKAATAAKSNAEKSQQRMMDNQKQTSKAAQDKIDALLKRIINSKKLTLDAQTGVQAKSTEGKSDAEKRVAELYADAEKMSQKKKKTAGQTKNQKPRQPSKKQVDEAKKKKSADVPFEQQIKNLQKNMERQLKNTSNGIRKRNQAAIKKLIDAGTKESDPEIKALKEKLNLELKENEAKIRQRVEERINRIRKEAAARAKS